MGDKEALSFTVISTDEIEKSDYSEIVTASEANVRDMSVSGNIEVNEEKGIDASREIIKQETPCKQDEDDEKFQLVTDELRKKESEIENNELQEAIRQMRYKRNQVLQEKLERGEIQDEKFVQIKAKEVELQDKFEEGLNEYCTTVAPMGFHELNHKERIAAIKYQSLQFEEDLWESLSSIEKEIKADYFREAYERILREQKEKNEIQQREKSETMQDCQSQDEQKLENEGVKKDEEEAKQGKSLHNQRTRQEKVLEVKELHETLQASSLKDE